MFTGVAGFCLALYDYEAGCDDELTFYEGQVIRILSKVPHNVDDGWWEGEVDGRTGIFPSLVVEECREDGEPFTPQGEDEPPSSAPPVFTPPDVPVFLLAPQQVIITQPTPEMDATPGDQQVAGAKHQEGTDASFALTMSADQHDQYDSQFQETPSITEEKGAERGVDSSRPPFPKPLPPSSGGEGLGLEVAQIVITAATPTVEEPEQLFPSAEEPEPTAEEEKEEESKVANANDEEENVGAEPTPVPPSEERRASGSPAPDLDEDLPTDSAPFPISSSTGSEEDTYTGPSTAENSQSQPAPAPAGQQLSADDDCAAGAAGEAAEAAEAGQAGQAGQADQAGHAGHAGAAAEAGQTAEAGQAAAARVAVDAVQPVGGRGSIPDELEPHQLAKLQDLKESNA
ncbi:Endophilin-A [Gryllus bimaculatus]|nr:Endophilin-A [Gryllus bimaculatus]